MILETNTNKSGLMKKKRKEDKSPRCRTYRKIQNEDEVTVTDKGLYVPYEQNFDTETMFNFVRENNA